MDTIRRFIRYVTALISDTVREKILKHEIGTVAVLAGIAVILAAVGVYQTVCCISGGVSETSSAILSQSKHVTTIFDVAPSIANGGEATPVVRISQSEVSIELSSDGYGEAPISAEYISFDGGDKEIVWSSENETIAEYSDGVIKAYSPGTIELYAETADGEASDYCIVKVIRRATGLWLDDTSVTLSGADAEKSLSARVLPDDATDQSIIWSSSDSDVAAVDEYGIVTAVSKGTADITAATADGGFTSVCRVTVTDVTPVDGSIKITTTPLAALRPEDTFTYKATLEQSSRDRTITWTSSNTDVATVDENGTVTAIADGITMITAASTAGLSDTVTLTVNSEETNIYTYGSVAVAKPDENYEPNSQITEKSSSSSTYGSSYTSSYTLSGYSSNYSQTVSTASGEVVYTSYSYTLDSMVNLHLNMSSTQKYNGSAASAAMIEKYIDPNSFSSGSYKFQFLDLSASNGVSAATLNSYLSGKGTLAGQGSAYVQASKDFNISEIYLVAHSCLETGNGTSRLAQGVQYNGVTVYNMYGIGAVDGNAVQGGAKKAYEMGWTTPEKAIYGGAQWISEHYINNSQYRQNTLYKMRWNPDSPGVHEYATSIEWAVSQSSTIQKIFQSFPDAVLRFEVPVYSGMQAPSLN